MSLSNTVKTHLIDPRSHGPQRTEFRLDDGFYASNWKLIDLGVYDPNIPANTGAYYPQITGVLQSIRNLYLYSGSTALDQTQNCPQYAAMEVLKTTNQGSEDLNRNLLLNGNGYAISHTNGSLTDPLWVSYYNTIDNRKAINLQVPITRSSFQGQSGSASLSLLLKFLKSTSVLPRIPDLRLVIEWDTNPDSYWVDPNSTTYNNLRPVPLQPTLVVDELLGLDDKDAMSYNIPYLSTLVERFDCPAATSTTQTTQSSFKSQTFTGKFVKDLTFYNLTKSSLANDLGYLTNANRSPAQLGERLQLVVNGQTFLPDRGIDNPALKLHFFNDAQSQLNIPLAASLPTLVDTSGLVISGSASAITGQFSVASVKVGKVIDELRIEYERLRGTPAWQQDDFQLLAFGTVARNLEVKNGVVRVSY